MSKRVDWATNEVLPREKPQLTVEEAEARLAELDLRLGEGEGARSERFMLEQVLESPRPKKVRRGGRRGRG